MTKDEILEVLSDHKLWLLNKGGKQADLEGAYLRGANLRGANLWGADLRGADLWGANLRGANLRNADLWGANLCNANLWGANLCNADLQGANLRNADLRGADLWGANLRGATYGTNVPMSLIPIQVSGFRYFVLILDSHIKIGCELHSIKDWQMDKAPMSDDDKGYWQEVKPALMEICKIAGRI